MAAILAAPLLFHAFKVLGLGVSIYPRLVEGLLECLKFSPVCISVGGGTPEAGPLPRGLRLQHDDFLRFRGHVSIAVASLECGSEEFSLSVSDQIHPLSLDPFIPVETKGGVIGTFGVTLHDLVGSKEQACACDQ